MVDANEWLNKRHQEHQEKQRDASNHDVTKTSHPDANMPSDLTREEFARIMEVKARVRAAGGSQAHNTLSDKETARGRFVRWQVRTGRRPQAGS